MITLKRPIKEYESKAVAFKQEFIDNGETTINGSELLDQMDSYDEWLRSVTANTSGMDKLQLSVERSNEASVKTITKNGGKYERSFTFEGEEADVYIINLV